MNRRGLITAMLALIPAPLLAQWRERPYWPTPVRRCRPYYTPGVRPYTAGPWPGSMLFRYRAEPMWGFENDFFPGEEAGERYRGRVAFLSPWGKGRVICSRCNLDDHRRFGLPTIFETDPRSAYDWVMADPEN